jgi:AcrR family transcriptional regulator
MARGLTAGLAVAAAIEIADESGLDAVTMAAVAKRCGFTTMSLYRHVASKDDLLRRMLDVVLGTPPPFDTSDWRAGLAAWSRAMLDVLDQHPWGIDVPITGKLDTHAQLAWLDRGLRRWRARACTRATRPRSSSCSTATCSGRPGCANPSRRTSTGSSRPPSTSRPTPRWRR